VRDEIDAEALRLLAGMGANLLAQPPDELVEPARVVLDLRTHALAEVLRDRLVVAVDHDAPRRQRVVEDLAPVRIDVPVPVVLHQPHERRLEHVPHDRAVPALARLRRAEVEAHVRRGDGLFDLALRAGIAAHVDDRVERRLELGGHGLSFSFGMPDGTEPVTRMRIASAFQRSLRALA
jgi:hypothetical protein